MPPNRAHKTGLIFDLDGTLVNTLPDMARSINLARERMGLEPLPERDIIRHVGDGARHLVEQSIPVAPSRLDEAYRHYLECYDRHMLDTSHLNPGVSEALERFKGRKLAVVTNKPLGQTEKILTGLGIRHRFLLVLGGDSLPEKKPHPLPILHFLNQAGLTPRQVTIIGDGINDIRAGKAAGITTVGCTFGVATPEQLTAAGTDHLISHMDELEAILG